MIAIWLEVSIYPISMNVSIEVIAHEGGLRKWEAEMFFFLVSKFQSYASTIPLLPPLPLYFAQNHTEECI